MGKRGQPDGRKMQVFSIRKTVSHILDPIQQLMLSQLALFRMIGTFFCAHLAVRPNILISEERL